jgi:RNA polymerase sigma-70 factor (ECF subfamily)
MKTPTDPHDIGPATNDNSTRAMEEAQLLVKVGGGDRASFEELHRRLSTLLFSSALGILNSREAAEDVTQDVFVQIWEKAPSYDPARGKPATWALTMARNKAIDRLRATQRQARLREQAGEEEKVAGPYDDQDSLQTALSHERSAALLAVMEKLAPEQREAIRLAYFEDMPYPNVARVLGVPLGTVKARIRRGMQRLRELLRARL